MHKNLVRHLTICALILWSGAARADAPPQRIVAAGGELTEIVFALGAGGRLVGVDSTSRFPAAARKKEQIGYVRRVSAEGILSLKPDLLLGASDMGPPASVEQLRLAGVQVALAPEGDNPAGVVDKILFVGKHLGLDTEARRLARRVETELARSIQMAARESQGRRVIFVLSIGDNGVLVGGEDTAAGEIIRLAGGINAAQGFKGYKPMSREAIVQAQPDVVLTMIRRASSHGDGADILARPEFKLTPAAGRGALVTMDGLLLLGFGPRTPQAVTRLSRAINR